MDGKQSVCEFCDSIQSINNSGCLNCGARLTKKNILSTDLNILTEAFHGAINQTNEHFSRSRFRLVSTVLVLALAILTGVFWQKSRSASPSLSQSNSLKDPLTESIKVTQKTETPILVTPIPITQSTNNHNGMIEARWTQSLAALLPLRMFLLMDYQMKGDWPNSFADINLDQSKLSDGMNIDTVELGQNGQIYAHLSSYFGTDMRISLWPKKIMSGTSIKWVCETNVPIRNSANLCVFRSDVNLQK